MQTYTSTSFTMPGFVSELQVQYVGVGIESKKYSSILFLL